jgi:uncharacterized protein
MIESLYQKWYFARTQLAQRILSLLLDGPGDPLALVGERRIGKTSHILNELMPAARQRGLLPVYVDIYQHRADPLAAINYALQEAIDDIEVPSSKTGKRLKTTVKRIGVGSIGVDLGDEPARRRPEDAFLLIDWLLKTLVRAARQPVLLIFDEIQELATHTNGENIVSAIRSAITKSKDNVRVIFTGSSQDKLLQMFSRARAALYEGASTLAFPHLGPDFIDFLAQRARSRFKHRPSVAELSEAFERLHHQPRALIDLLLLYSSSEETSLLSLLDSSLEDQLAGLDFRAHWSSLSVLEQRICTRVARGGDVTSVAARREYAADSAKEEVAPGTVNGALRRLVLSHVLAKPPGSRGRYLLDDALFAEWVRRQAQIDR